jgi:hypothetical protein
MPAAKRKPARGKRPFAIAELRDDLAEIKRLAVAIESQLRRAETAGIKSLVCEGGGVGRSRKDLRRAERGISDAAYDAIRGG